MYMSHEKKDCLCACVPICVDLRESLCVLRYGSSRLNVPLIKIPKASVVASTQSSVSKIPPHPLHPLHTVIPTIALFSVSLQIFVSLAL